MMSYLPSSEEYEIFRLVRILGPSKVKELLKAIHDKEISVDSLLAYLRSTGYKVPSPLESRIEGLERRISILEEGKPSPPLTPPQAPSKEWSDEKLKRYLDRCKERRQFTYQYYKILTDIDGKISRDDLIKKIGESTGRKFIGYSLAGVQAGINMSVTKKNYERLDWKDKDSRQFSLNKKYREKMRKYFRAEQESVS